MTFEWRRLRLVDLCSTHVDCVNRTAPLVDGPTPFKMIRTTNVRDGFIDTENVRCVSEETFRRWTRRLVPRRGDIILTREAPLGGVGKVRTDDDIFLGQRLYHFRADPQVADPNFLLYALMGPDLQAQIRSFGSGSTVEHMRLPDIEKLELDAPPIDEQRRLGGILAAYDDLIENCERRIRVLDEMARALYREWFVNFRYPGHEKVPLVDSPLGRVPKGWNVRPVGDAFGILGGGTPSRKEPAYWSEGTISWFSPTDLTTAGTMFVERSRDAITPRGLQESSAKMFPAMSVMMTSRATIGAIAINTTPACTNQGFITCIPTNRFPLYLLFHWLHTNVPLFERMASGSTFKEISRGVFRTIELAIPQAPIAARFEEMAGPLANETLLLQRQIQNLRRTRDLLRPRLLSGQLSVEDAAA